MRKKHLCSDVYRYREKNQLKNGLIKWQCTFGNCRAVGYLDDQQEFTLKTEHAHLPSLSKIQAKKFANEVREKPQTLVTLPTDCLQRPNGSASLCSTDNTELLNISSEYKPNQAASLRNNAKTKKKLESVDEIPEPLKLTHSGDTFLYFDSGKSDSRILVFATLPALDLLSPSEICHCDGTFSVAPDVFYQVYTIHGVIEIAVISLVYALLPNKTQDTYENFLTAWSNLEKN